LWIGAEGGDRERDALIGDSHKRGWRLGSEADKPVRQAGFARNLSFFWSLSGLGGLACGRRRLSNK
jgi:hypothetical protein